ncbi:MFS transporter [Gorillibacterium sp. CAU 1737]|uniref:MFS transporter n=1 Tax=Gorillibacterium sp. CAU 1737 TaxID=3140362 RepID=UPI003260BBA6
MKELFRNRLFVRLFLASFASQLGTTVGNMAFAFYLLDRFAAQPGYASLAELMYSLPTLFVFFLVGVVADRYDRQRIAANSAWIRLGLTAILFGSIWLGVLPLIFAVLFLRSAVAKFYAPAETALLQGILHKEQYISASGLNQMLFGVFMLFGVGIGAIAYTMIGIYGAVAIDAFGFLTAGCLLQTCSFPKGVRSPGKGEAQPDERIARSGLSLSRMVADFREGLHYIRQRPLLMALIAGFFLFGFLNGGFAILPMFTMKYKLAPDEYKTFSSLFALFLGAGLFLGSGIAPTIVKRWKPHGTILAALLLSGILMTVLGFVDQPWVYLGLVFGLGFLIAPLNVAIGGWIPSLVDPSMMGRVTAWNDPVLMLGQSITLGLVTLLYPGTLSLLALYLALAGLMLTAFLLFAFTLPRLSRQAEAAAEAPSTVMADPSSLSSTIVD